jgi:hypothetical protein
LAIPERERSKISTFCASSIPAILQCENASGSVRINLEFDLNETDESDSNSSKHDDSRISTFHGVSID